MLKFYEFWRKHIVEILFKKEKFYQFAKLLTLDSCQIVRAEQEQARVEAAGTHGNP